VIASQPFTVTSIRRLTRIIIGFRLPILAGLITAWASWPLLVHANLIHDENARAGTTLWRLSKPAANHEIEGYASLTSVNRGERLLLFVNTADPTYTIDIYRMGWYDGAGARLVLGGIVRQAVAQPQPLVDPLTGLVECNWTDPYVLTAGSTDDGGDWLSGVYLAKLTAGTTGGQSYIVFVVREDGRPSDYLFQSSVTTFQAYNNWGGKSLYDFNSTEARRARRVSFNRPYAPSSNPAAAYGAGAGEFITNSSVPPRDPSSAAGWEYNMVRWLEREGYDVTFSTNIDTHADAKLLSSHKVWLSVGHDEYWTWEMRVHVERAAHHRTNLSFLSGNVCYWQIRLDPSPSTKAPFRTIVAYKDDALKEDPYAADGNPVNDHLITTRWREAPVNRPEESLIGVMYDGNPVDADIVIVNPLHWTMSGTGLGQGDRLPRLLGYEADRAFTPPAPGTGTLDILAESPYLSYGEPRIAHMSMRTLPNGAMVFSAGTIQWSWALDDFNAPQLLVPALNPAAQQITRNVLARFAGDVFPTPRVDLTRLQQSGAEPVFCFSAAASSDPDGAIVLYGWDFGDGQRDEGAAVTHRYGTPGRYPMTLTVRDDRGAASSLTMMLDIPGSGAGTEAH